LHLFERSSRVPAGASPHSRRWESSFPINNLVTFPCTISIQWQQQRSNSLCLTAEVTEIAVADPFSNSHEQQHSVTSQSIAHCYPSKPIRSLSYIRLALLPPACLPQGLRRCSRKARQMAWHLTQSRSTAAHRFLYHEHLQSVNQQTAEPLRNTNTRSQSTQRAGRPA
jgi:sugar diacid utilization regulator